jgi:hypothetical protein
MRYEIRPLGPWLDPVTDPRANAGRFTASWSDTLVLLEREVDYLCADLVVVQVDVIEADLRRDGMLRAGAKVGFPGVRVSFDSIHGPLTYVTDAYDHLWSRNGLAGWQANVRAVALALEALRAVDRYGVTRRGEQYRGWTPIDAKPAAMTRDQAAEFIVYWAGAEHGEVAKWASLILGDPAELRRAFRLAAARAHPDRAGGDHDTMARLNAARDLLNGAGRG